MSVPAQERRVVITGIGAVTPLGNSVAENWQKLVRGESGIGPITLFDASTFPTRIAGEVRGFDFAPLSAQDDLLRWAGRNTQFAIGAADEAWRDAAIRTGILDPSQMGVYFAAGDGGCDFPNFVATINASWAKNGTLVDSAAYCRKSQESFHPFVEMEQEPCLTLNHLARRFGLRGPVANCLTACAASSQAIGEAFETIRRGDATVMMTGGTHSMVHPYGIGGFSLLTTLSTRNDEPARASRPFDRTRDGFVLSEGAGVLVLEELSFAQKRGAKIYGELVGYGSTADAYRLTDTHPEGRGAMKAMALAMAQGAIAPADVDYINAHGTSTVVNDEIETVAIKKVMGETARKIPVSSTKSMMGHLIAAAGAVELIACVQAIKHQILPPTINHEEPDPACDLDYVPNEARKAVVRVCLSNSFGFGGQNITLAVRKFES